MAGPENVSARPGPARAKPTTTTYPAARNPGRNRVRKRPTRKWVGWGVIGQQSAAYHRTQGMGRWFQSGRGRDWPLHSPRAMLEGPDYGAHVTGCQNTLDGPRPTLGRWPRPLPLICAAPKPPFTGANRGLPALSNRSAEQPSKTRACANPNAPRHLPREPSRASCSPPTAPQRGPTRPSPSPPPSDARPARGRRPHGSTPATQRRSPIEFGTPTAPMPSSALTCREGWTHAGDKLTLSADAHLTNPYRAQYDPARPPTTPALILKQPPHPNPRLRLEAPALALPRRASPTNRARPHGPSTRRSWPAPSPSPLAWQSGPRGRCCHPRSEPISWTANAATENRLPSSTLPDTTPEGTYDLPLAARRPTPP